MAKRAKAGWWIRAAGLLAMPLVLAGLIAARWPAPEPVSADPPPVGGFAPFQHWPTDRKPDAVLVLTGQTFGYLSPCGCSRPQKGGLERRANFMAWLRDKGWPVIGFDLGDVAAPKKVPKQEMLKYVAAMESLRSMGYAAVGLGEYDFNQQLFDLLAAFTIQQKKEEDRRPMLLSANLVGKGNGNILTREDLFSEKGYAKLWVEDVEVVSKDPVTNSATLPIGVTAVIGPSAFEKLRKTDPTFEYLDNKPVIEAALKKMDAAKVEARVLLYTGTLEEAKAVAAAFPAFNVILCQIEESEPPQFPTVVNDGKTFIVQVGHKGQNTGVVGLYKTAAGIELKYQLMPLGEQFLTPAAEAGKHHVLGLLEGYTQKVKDQNLLAKYVEQKLPHPNMISKPDSKLAYVGADKCKSCHPNEFKIWSESKHSHAYDSLVKLAVNPKNRQFDGDCVSCHTTGFLYQTGYENEEKTAHLKHNGCENCHGPGSGHAANPNDKELLKLLAPWKGGDPEMKMPKKETLEALSKVKPGEPRPVQLTPKEQAVFNAVTTMCMKCHDGENDPKFDLNLYFPKVHHSGFKAQAGGGLPGNAK